ncbi:hypothetical protein BH20VER1_BH20VER1_09160 [soil metagenome]
MKRTTTEQSLEQLVASAVDRAFERHRKPIQKAVIEALEDAALVRAMEQADNRPVSAERVHRLLARRSES